MAEVVEFGTIPSAMVDAGRLAGLTATALGSYLVLCRSARFGTWETRPSIKRIAELSGFTNRGVEKGIALLIERGLIKRVSGGGPGNTSVYRIETNPERAFGICNEETPNGRSVNKAETPNTGDKKPRTGVPETPNGRDVNPEQVFGPTHRTHRTQQQNSRETAAAEDCRQALSEAGIGEPAQSELASLPSLTAAMIRAEVARCIALGKGTGIMIPNLHAIAAAAKQRAERAADDEARRQRQAEEDRAALEAVKALPATELDRLKSSLIADLDQVGDKRRSFFMTNLEWHDPAMLPLIIVKWKSENERISDEKRNRSPVENDERRAGCEAA